MHYCSIITYIINFFKQIKIDYICLGISGVERILSRKYTHMDEFITVMEWGRDRFALKGYLSQNLPALLEDPYRARASDPRIDVTADFTMELNNGGPTPTRYYYMFVLKRVGSLPREGHFNWGDWGATDKPPAQLVYYTTANKQYARTTMMLIKYLDEKRTQPVSLEPDDPCVIAIRKYYK